MSILVAILCVGCGTTENWPSMLVGAVSILMATLCLGCGTTENWPPRLVDAVSILVATLCVGAVPQRIDHSGWRVRYQF